MFNYIIECFYMGEGDLIGKRQKFTTTTWTEKCFIDFCPFSAWDTFDINRQL